MGTEESLRERKKLRTREDLVRASTRLIAADGLDAVSVDRIAEAAQVSTRTFFNYFRTKEDAAVGWDPREFAAMVQVVRDTPASVSDFDALIGALSARASRRQLDADEWRERMRVIAAEPRLLAYQAGRFAEMEQELVAALVARRGHDQGSDLRVAVLVAVTAAAIRTAVMRWAGESRHDLADYLQPALDQLRSGFAETPSQ